MPDSPLRFSMHKNLIDPNVDLSFVYLKILLSIVFVPLKRLSHGQRSYMLMYGTAMQYPYCTNAVAQYVVDCRVDRVAGIHSPRL